ncbi:hypothetical protein VNO77_04225 [Canavalia gladiata]|uniref:Uncharacterized protein n=1 Tax=Canavalia gladiata TaxID=3824 RepID=A0AAN9N1T8_CANGL
MREHVIATPGTVVVDSLPDFSLDSGSSYWSSVSDDDLSHGHLVAIFGGHCYCELTNHSPFASGKAFLHKESSQGTGKASLSVETCESPVTATKPSLSGHPILPP